MTRMAGTKAIEATPFLERLCPAMTTSVIQFNRNPLQRGRALPSYMNVIGLGPRM
jgi:hypothetical protein